MKRLLGRRLFAELRRDDGNHIGHVLRSGELRETFIPQIRADFPLRANDGRASVHMIVSGYGWQ